MIETISVVVLLLAILFVALGPKPRDKKDKGPDSSDKS